FKTFRFSPDEAGGGTATAEPETVTMNDVTEDAIFAAAAAELDAAIANRDNPQGQPRKPAQPVLPDPNPPAEKPKAPETEAKDPARLPSNLPDFMQELYGDEPPAPEAGWQPEGQPTQAADSAVQN